MFHRAVRLALLLEEADHLAAVRLGLCDGLRRARLLRVTMLERCFLDAFELLGGTALHINEKTSIHSIPHVWDLVLRSLT